MDRSQYPMSKPIIGLECLQLVLSAAASGVIAHEIFVGKNLSEFATVYVTLMGFIMVQMVVICSEAMKTPLHKMILILVHTAASAMYGATAGVTLSFLFSYSDWNNLPGGDRLLAAGVLAICNAVLAFATLVLVVVKR